MHIIIIPYNNKEKNKAGKIHQKIKIKKKPLNEIPEHINKSAKIDNSTVELHNTLKKEDGTIVTVGDLPDNISFGNGITCLGDGIRLKNGEKIPCVFAVFEDNVGISSQDLINAEK